MTALAPSPCLVENCKNKGEYMIYIEGKRSAKGYTLCRQHINWLKRFHQIGLKDYE